MAELRIPGVAFETVGNTHDRMTIISADPVLQVGDTLPAVEGLVYSPVTERYKGFVVSDLGGIVVLSVLNACGTEVCYRQTTAMEELRSDNLSSRLKIVSIIQTGNDDDLARVTEEAGLSHDLLSIDRDTAIRLGVALEPEEDSREFWHNMLLRTVIVRDNDGKVAHIERVMDQMQEPNYQALNTVLERVAPRE